MATLYPGKIDTGGPNGSLPSAVDNTTPVTAASVNIIRDAVLAVENTLGVNPQGIYTTVGNRLSTIEQALIASQTMAGDVTGLTNASTVVRLQGIPLSANTPTPGQVLELVGGVWTPSSQSSGITFSGDLTGTGSSQTVIGLRGFSIATTAPTNGQVLEYNSGTSKWTPTNQVSGVTWSNDLAGSTNANQWIAALSGSGGSGGSITINATTLAFASGQSTPAIDQTALGSTSSGSGATGQSLTFAAQAGQAATGASNNGGNGGQVVVSSGAGGTSGSATPGTAGNMLLQTGGSTQVTITPTSVTMAAYGTGVAHFSSAGLLSSSTIVNADVSATAAIAGTKISPNFGSQNVSTTGTLSAGGTTVTSLQDTAFSSTGVVHNDASGNFTSSLIVNADVSATAAIAVSKLAAGTSAQILQNNGTPTPTWTTVSGDVSITNAGVTTVTGIQGNTFTSGSPVKGQFVVATSTSNYGPVTLSGDVTESSSTAGAITVVALQGFSVSNTTPTTNYVLTWNGSAWTPEPTSGSGTTWANDLVNSTSTNQYVSSLSFSSSAAGGTIAINGTGSALQWASGNTGPLFNQAAQSSTSSGSGATGSNFTISAQAGQAATGATHNGGNGGEIIFSSGAGGTSGSATPGTAGNMLLQTGGSTQITVTPTSVTMAAYGTGVAHFSSVGLISSSTIVNADVSAAAAIAVSKLASGTSAQILLNNATPTPTWTTVGGDASISNTGSVTVSAIQGNSVTPGGVTKGQFLVGSASNTWAPTTISGDVSSSASTAGLLTVTGIQGNTFTSGAPTKGQFVVATSTTNYGPVTLSGDVSESASTAGQLTVTAIQTNAVKSGTLTSTQDGYVLTWVNSNSDWEAKPNSAGSGVTWAQDLSGSTNTAQYVASISGSGGGGGSIPLNVTTLAFASGQSTPALNQTALGSTSSGSGSAGQNLTFQAQAGQAATGASHNGGNGGEIIISSGAGGTSGSATPGSPGDLLLQLGGTTLIDYSGTTIGNITFTNTAAVPNYSQTALSSTSSGSGSVGQNWTFTAQAGQAATGASNNGGNGGELILSSGAGGTSGSATPGTAGTLLLQNGGVTQVQVSTTSVTLNGSLLWSTGNAPARGYVSVVMSSDNNLTLSGSQYNAFEIVITSSTSLTATRNIVMPLTQGGSWIILNNTTGGQSLQIIGSSGTGFTISNGVSSTVFTDGTNFYGTSGGTGSFTAGGDLSGTSSSQTVIGIEGKAITGAPTTAGQILLYNGTQWAPSLTPQSKSTTYTVLVTDGDIFADLSSSGWTLTLPSAPFTGEKHTIKDSKGFAGQATDTGTTASLTFSTPTVTLTGGSGFTAAMVGLNITISNSSTVANNGTFAIASFVSASSITYTNASGAADAGGAVHWSVANNLIIAGNGKTIEQWGDTGTASNLLLTQNYDSATLAFNGSVWNLM